MGEKIKEVFLDIFGIEPDEFSVDLTAEDIIAWNSLNHIRMVLALQEAYLVEFEAEETMEMLSVQGIQEILKNKGVD